MAGLDCGRRSLGRGLQAPSVSAAAGGHRCSSLVTSTRSEQLWQGEAAGTWGAGKPCDVFIKGVPWSFPAWFLENMREAPPPFSSGSRSSWNSASDDMTPTAQPQDPSSKTWRGRMGWGGSSACEGLTGGRLLHPFCVPLVGGRAGVGQGRLH